MLTIEQLHKKWPTFKNGNLAEKQRLKNGEQVIHALEHLGIACFYEIFSRKVSREEIKVAICDVEAEFSFVSAKRWNLYKKGKITKRELLTIKNGSEKDRIFTVMHVDYEV